jgi:hypothetical protein
MVKIIAFYLPLIPPHPENNKMVGAKDLQNGLM